MPINMNVEFPKLENENSKLRYENEKLMEQNKELLEALRNMFILHDTSDRNLTKEWKEKVSKALAAIQKASIL